jgi:hypothetical protein
MGGQGGGQACSFSFCGSICCWFSEELLFELESFAGGQASGGSSSFMTAAINTVVRGSDFRCLLFE